MHPSYTVTVLMDFLTLLGKFSSTLKDAPQELTIIVSKGNGAPKVLSYPMSPGVINTVWGGLGEEDCV